MSDATVMRAPRAADPDGPVKQLYFVYAADLSLSSAFQFLGELMSGETACELCAITHTGLLERKSWKEYRRKLGIGVRPVLRNMGPKGLAAAVAGEYPAVVAETHDGTFVRLLSASQLRACEGNPKALYELIEGALERLRTAPGAQILSGASP
jgi:hypothetical protein